MNDELHETRSVLEHVVELRTKLFIALIALVVGGVTAHVFHGQIINYILRPVGLETLVFLSPLEPLFFILKIDIIAGCIATFPILIWCLFSYIKPALSGKARVVVLLTSLISVFLLILGLLYAYFITVPLSLKFLFSISIPGIESSITAKSYLNFFFTQAIIIMAVFQIPIVLVIGFLLNAFSVKSLSVKRRYIYLIGIIAIAILTPTTDVITLGIVMAPTIVIFEISLIIGRIIELSRRKKKVATKHLFTDNGRDRC